MISAVQHLLFPSHVKQLTQSINDKNTPGSHLSSKTENYELMSFEFFF
jgi:hypothetical protein